MRFGRAGTKILFEFPIRLAYNLWSAVEEGLEMGGVVLGIRALLDYLGIFHIRVAPDQQCPQNFVVTLPALG